MRLFFAVLPFMAFYSTVLFYEIFYRRDIQHNYTKNSVSPFKAFWKVFITLSFQNIINYFLSYFDIIANGDIRILQD